MKLNLFLLTTIFAVLHLCKAGVLRLQKRAAFYIANETACVVDNIVYSSGDPIPTDDPCETCKCRPPGFACMFKECRIKPGCRAVRQAGQCCPEYVCGCEHNGKMYQDGEEIRDSKNPCYICHCQGSSIACAFAECFFRHECPPIYVPGECCPQYSNCTRDVPENNLFNENNAVPSLLLPALNDESIIPVNLQTTVKELSSVITTNPPTQSSVIEDKNEKVTTTEIRASTDKPSEFPTTESVSSVAVGSELDPVDIEKSAAKETVPSEISKDVVVNDETVEESKEAVLLNSETDIIKDEKILTTTIKYEETETEKSNDDSHPTVVNVEKVIKDVESTEKTSEIESSGTEIPITEKQVKNSAADNSKSLKLSDDEVAAVESENKSDKIEETQTEVPKELGNKLNETVTQTPTESSSKIKPFDITESKPVSDESVPEESQVNPQSTLYSNSDKVKSESVETVTIVVHVAEKTNTTETDFISKETTPASVTSTTQGNLLKSNELNSTEQHIEEKISTLAATTFESLPSTTVTSKYELTTDTPLPDKTLKEVESRSEKTEEISDAEEHHISEKTSDSKTKESSTTTIPYVNITESNPAEVRADEETSEGTKTDEPLTTTVKEEKSNIEMKITADSDSEREIQNLTESESKNVVTTEETKSEIIAEEIKPEVREEDPKEEEKETTITEKVQEITSTDKVESSSPQTEVIKPKVSAEETESREKSENIEKKAAETHEQKSEMTTESKVQVTEVSTHTEVPKSDKE